LLPDLTPLNTVTIKIDSGRAAKLDRELGKEAENDKFNPIPRRRRSTNIVKGVAQFFMPAAKLYSKQFCEEH
jgi:hypothetical protein